MSRTDRNQTFQVKYHDFNKKIFYTKYEYQTYNNYININQIKFNSNFENDKYNYNCNNYSQPSIIQPINNFIPSLQSVYQEGINNDKFSNFMPLIPSKCQQIPFIKHPNFHFQEIKVDNSVIQQDKEEIIEEDQNLICSIKSSSINSNSLPNIHYEVLKKFFIQYYSIIFLRVYGDFNYSKSQPT